MNINFMNHSEEIEGVIKYTCQQVSRPISAAPDLAQFFELRKLLFSRNLIGVDGDGFGYGNISFRLFSSPRFLITGSQTSGLEFITARDLAEVLVIDIEKNFLKFAGHTQASSEAMTHAALYQVDSNIKGVVHIHSNSIWNRMMKKLPTTRPDVAYGTPAMAYEMMRLYRCNRSEQEGIFVLGGHQDGLISYGPTLEIATMNLLKLDIG